MSYDKTSSYGSYHSRELNRTTWRLPERGKGPQPGEASGISWPVDSSHGKGSWTQKAHISQGSIMEAETIGERCVQTLSTQNIVPICPCKAISAVMLEARARTWVVGKGHEQNGTSQATGRQVPHPHSQADPFRFIFSDFGNGDILSKPGFFLCQKLSTDRPNRRLRENKGGLRGKGGAVTGQVVASRAKVVAQRLRDTVYGLSL